MDKLNKKRKYSDLYVKTDSSKKKLTDIDFKNAIKNCPLGLNYNNIKSTDDLYNNIIDKSLELKGINKYDIMQGFTFEGNNGDFIKNNILYGLVLQKKNMISQIHISKELEANEHKANAILGYSEKGIPISLDETIQWLNKNKFN